MTNDEIPNDEGEKLEEREGERSPERFAWPSGSQDGDHKADQTGCRIPLLAGGVKRIRTCKAAAERGSGGVARARCDQRNAGSECRRPNRAPPANRRSPARAIRPRTTREQMRYPVVSKKSSEVKVRSEEQAGSRASRDVAWLGFETAHRRVRRHQYPPFKRLQREARGIEMPISKEQGRN